jgi:hypothetical protein
VIRYVLFKNHQNSGSPIKRDELTQIVTKNYRHRTLPAVVIDEAKHKLASVFGFEMRELQRARPSSTNQGRASSQQSNQLLPHFVLFFKYEKGFVGCLLGLDLFRFRLTVCAKLVLESVKFPIKQLADFGISY